MQPVNPFIKRAAQVLLPARLFTTAQSIRSRNYQRELQREWGVEKATQEMIAEYGLTVLHGPFRGMRYPQGSLASRDGVPILFGTYELELHDIIEEVAAKRYDSIIDIGSAEGYYAVGLAMRTRCSVIAFDCEPRERSYVRQMARFNGVQDHVEVRSWCDPGTLEKLTRGKSSLVISDCEGYELKLFEGKVLSALGDCDLIIEVHELLPDASVRSILEERFQGSHTARVITSDRSRTGSDVPDKWNEFAREPRTPGQQWLYLTPRRDVRGAAK